MKPNLIFAAAFAIAANTASIFAQGGASAVVLWRTNTALVQVRDQWEPMAEDMKMPGDINVFTNGAFQIATGKLRTLKEGQRLRGDGYLINEDGSTMPVFDHIAMKGNVV